MEENKSDHFVMITVADPPGPVGDTSKENPVFTAPPGNTDKYGWDVNLAGAKATLALVLLEMSRHPPSPYRSATCVLLSCSIGYLSWRSLPQFLQLPFMTTGTQEPPITSMFKPGMIAHATEECQFPFQLTGFPPFSRSDISLLYNDHAVLENHHVSAVYRLLQNNEDLNILSNLSKDDWR